jgi:hypothetical protein|nr:MAG TPA: hypothetical protein [Caudoviricetes sp.]
MEKTINIKFDEKQLAEISKRVIENIMKETRTNLYELSDTGREDPKEKRSVMYLEFNEVDSTSDKGKLYFGHAFHTLTKRYASEFCLSREYDLKKALELKNQGWKEEVVYK